ncbi:MAG: tRNA (N6-threonylcarbamoyladenosine(37)-N6)-methyltransferase TrmO [Akkermansia sp.]|nr:tRNA (N6-threonylcarbamoyladenosine(37)-N6)-methyltransferase TrmO [Akkermansia sp.]
MQPIAHIRSPYAEKFGVPRQGNLAPHVISEIIFEPPYRNPECVRGLEAFSHLWLIWKFHHNGETWHPTVRPPRLGGNTRLGVFATRSPFRPNGLGLSVVKLLSVEPGPVLRVSGADMVDGSPIYDIKPYVPYADSIPEAAGGFTSVARPLLQVEWQTARPDEPAEWVAALEETLAQDPRPAYQDDAQRVYHLLFRPWEISFRVENGKACIISLRKQA